MELEFFASRVSAEAMKYAGWPMNALPWVSAIALAAWGGVLGVRGASLQFETTDRPGEFTFDTGTLQGQLRAGGKSLGLTAVTHLPSGRRLDRSNGLLSHYRVFTRGVRYGGGAWDWPSEARRRDDGTVEVRWPAANSRPFELSALYRWHRPDTVVVETRVRAREALEGFESFLASYFDPAFTNAGVLVAPEPGSDRPRWVGAKPAAGDWQMFPRDDNAVALIRDGRWKLPPNPVEWAIQPRFAFPIGLRSSPTDGLSAILLAPSQDCFALATPHETEGHYSMYLALFGRDLKPGETARARVFLVLASVRTDAVVLNRFRELTASEP
jgi:hypothetical protein